MDEDSGYLCPESIQPGPLSHLEVSLSAPTALLALPLLLMQLRLWEKLENFVLQTLWPNHENPVQISLLLILFFILISLVPFEHF